MGLKHNEYSSIESVHLNAYKRCISYKNIAYPLEYLISHYSLLLTANFWRTKRIGCMSYFYIRVLTEWVGLERVF